jgi:hypothetical protein
VDILRITLRIDDEANEANARRLGPACFVGELRLRQEERNRR